MLDAVEHVMGLGIFFPPSEALESTVNYVAAKEPDIEFRDQYEAAAQEASALTAQDEEEMQRETDDSID